MDEAAPVPDEHALESGIPPEVFAVASMVPIDGRSKVTRHPQARDIVEVLALVCLDGRTGAKGTEGLSWPDVARDLNRQFPGLDVTPQYLQSWTRTHIYPHLTIPKASLLSAIVERRNGLNLFEDLMQHTDETREAFRRAKADMGAIEYDKEGIPHRTGPTAAEVAALSRATGKLLKEVRDEAERFGLLPESRASSSGVTVNVNMDGMMANLSGRRKRVDPFADAIDVPHKAQDGSPPPS